MLMTRFIFIYSIVLSCLSVFFSCDAMQRKRRRISYHHRTTNNPLSNIERLNQELFYAANMGDLAKVQDVLEQGANVHAGDDRALFLATDKGFADIVRFLLLELPQERRADIHARNDQALWRAAVGGHLEIVRILARCGANVKAKDSIAFSAAAGTGNLAILEFLLDHGADIHGDNDAALIIAAKEGFRHIFTWLLQHGNYQTVPTRLTSFLQYGVEENEWGIVANLYHCGIDRTFLTTLTPEAKRDLYFYIAGKLYRPLVNKDWYAVEQVFEQIFTKLPRNELPEYVQNQIGKLIAPIVAEQLLNMRLSMPRQAQHIEERILSFIFGPSVTYFFLKYSSS